MEVIKFSYSPYSKFRVGAAVESGSERIYTGTNIENTSYGLTICAERVAIFNALSNGEKRILRILVYSDSLKNPKQFIYPCGACLQVIAEFNEEMEILLANGNGSIRKFSLIELLPNNFQINKGKR